MSDLQKIPEPIAHMFPSDIERFRESETFAQAYSIEVGNPNETSVELCLQSDLISAAQNSHKFLMALKEVRNDVDMMMRGRFVNLEDVIKELDAAISQTGA